MPERADTTNRLESEMNPGQRVENTITDEAAAQSAVDALTQAIELLDQAGADLPQIKQLTRAAASDADCALMVASNEARLAQRAAHSSARTN